MKILITMAGEGTRFKEIGIDIPKYMIKLGDKTLFNYALTSLNDFFDCGFIFIVQKKHDTESFIKKQCDILGIKEFEIIQISELTDGQSTTAFLADSVIGDSEPVIIYNIDTYVEKGELLKKDIVGDGYIPVFISNEDRLSYVKINEMGIATEVAEKVKISNLATIGFYYFDTWEKYKNAYIEYSNITKDEYKERYIAPLYNWMIKNNMQVHINIIDIEKIHILGTPEDVKEFYPAFGDNDVN